MTKLSINNSTYYCEKDETVLTALLRQNVNIPYSCQKGTCHSCLLQSGENPPKTAQNGLKNTEIAQNYFLACLCNPDKDMTLKLPSQDNFFTEARVISNRKLNRNTCLLTLESQEPLEYKAGQFVNLKRADGLTRSYSISSPSSNQNKLEFHIRKLENGKFSEWAHAELKPDDILLISEARGNCFYIAENTEQNMLLVGTGTGLAPLIGIIHDAIENNHSGEIYLFHGSSSLDDLYKIDELRQLAQKHSNLNYIPCVSSGEVPEGFFQGRANEVALTMHPNLNNWKVFLCGHPEMVSKMKMDAFLKGTSMSDIYADPFYISETSPED